jgi:nicotinate-nucleotide pyrophosphorylase (carboxylating)
MELHRLVETALGEDLAWGDVTSEAIIADSVNAIGNIVARQEGMLAGIEVAALVFSKVDPSLKFTSLVTDGDNLKPGQTIATISGRAASILSGERVALNFMQRLSGIATLTAHFVATVQTERTRITDTRKTTPGLRMLEKYAVAVGGGYNHRQNLSDGVLIKDNHLSALSAQGISLGEAIKTARQRARHTQRIEVEVTTLTQAEEALQAGADIILLDNMTLDEMHEAVTLIAGRALVEASGGIDLARVAAVARTGVDLISVGGITHSAKALDIALDFSVAR